MPAGSHRFPVGAIRCTVLSDGYYSYPIPWLFPDADPQQLHHSLDRHRLSPDHAVTPLTCLLIETGRHVILVDTGAGDSWRTAGAILARLEIEGIRARDVDTVILTHAHPDHIGGTLDARGRPAFPNARHVLAESEWDFWMTGRADVSPLPLPKELKSGIRDTAQRCLHAIRFQVEPAGGECEIVPGVHVLPAPGHTPGHLAILIESEGERLLNLADAAAHPLHLEEPGWPSGFDLAPGPAAATRRELAERAVAEGMHVMAFHFPFPSVGRIARRSEGGWEWIPGW
jgi:glyoxylase-like metal-dependent hydrolase (beta-lactamase superfamily II)